MIGVWLCVARCLFACGERAGGGRATELGRSSCVRLLTARTTCGAGSAVAHERLTRSTTARIDRYHRIVDEPSEPVTGGEPRPTSSGFH